MNGSGKMSRKFCRYVICVSNMGNLQNSSLKACLGHFVSLKNLFLLPDKSSSQEMGPKNTRQSFGIPTLHIHTWNPKANHLFSWMFADFQAFSIYIFGSSSNWNIHLYMVGLRVPGRWIAIQGFPNKKMGGFPQHGWWKEWKKNLIFFNGWFRGYIYPYFGKHPYS